MANRVVHRVPATHGAGALQRIPHPFFQQQLRLDQLLQDLGTEATDRNRKMSILQIARTTHSFCTFLAGVVFGLHG